MADERQHATLFELLRWALPTALVVLGLVFYFLYSAATPAVSAGLPTP